MHALERLHVGEKIYPYMLKTDEKAVFASMKRKNWIKQDFNDEFWIIKDQGIVALLEAQAAADDLRKKKAEEHERERAKVIQDAADRKKLFRDILIIAFASSALILLVERFGDVIDFLKKLLSLLSK